MKYITGQIVDKQRGFTIMELLVVIAMMALLSGVLIVNFNAQRGKRELRLAQNELVTFIRRAQSYALASRDVSTGVSARYYMVQFDRSTTPTSYKIMAIDKNYSAPVTIESRPFPTKVSLNGGSSLELEQPIKQPRDLATVTYPVCLQILFGLPYSQTYMVGSMAPCTNTISTTVQDPSQMFGKINSRAVITMQESVASTVRKVEINGITGSILGQ